MKKKMIRILNVEDEEVDHMALMRMVKKKDLPYDIDCAPSLTRALELIERKRYDIVLIDYRLPDGTGLELLERIKKIPSVFVTGSGDESVAVKAIKGGAYDYLIKDPKRNCMELLPATIEKVMRTHQLELEHRLSEELIIKQKAELEVINSKLSILYEITSKINQTIELDRLLANVLETVIKLEGLNIRPKGAIFIVEGEEMKLASNIGLSDNFISVHQGIKVGDCVCGIAAKTGEIIISRNVEKERRHGTTYHELGLHGDIILPFRAVDKVVGVLCLYQSTDSEVDEGMISVFLAIGSQVGIAINNARLYEKTKTLSLYDPLTRLANRRLMHIEFGKNIARIKRYGGLLSIVMIDIDYFKKYNDANGHLAGDKLLVDIAKIVLKETRETDLVARYGGEEFIVFLAETGLPEAYIVAEKIRKAIEERAGITISLGISYYRGGNQKEEELINEADDALYKAKQNGRNRVEVCRQS